MKPLSASFVRPFLERGWAGILDRYLELGAAEELSLLFPKGRVDQLLVEARAAEETLKAVQQFREAAGIPAINEIRYAGYHITLAVNPELSAADRDAEVLKAVRHYQRARYEAAEAGILHALEQISTFKHDYRVIVVGDLVTDWPGKLRTCREAQEAIGTPREIGDQRELDHQRHAERFKILTDIVAECDDCRDDLNARVRREVKDSRRFVIGSILALLGLVATVVLGLPQIMGTKLNSDTPTTVEATTPPPS